MIRTSLDASIATTLCLCLLATPALAQNATTDPHAASRTRVTPQQRAPEHPQQRPSVQPRVVTPRPSAVPGRTQTVPQGAQSRWNERPNQAPLSGGRELTPAQRGYTAAPQQQPTRPAYGVQPVQRQYQVQPAQRQYQVQPAQRQYQLPSAGQHMYQAPTSIYGAPASRGPAYSYAGARHTYTLTRPVPAYTPAQVHGYQWQALRGYGPGAGSAALRMGDIYTSSSVQQPDPVRAARWYAYSTHLGNVSAAFSLGQLYLAGEGVPLDPVRGYALIDWAAANGDPDAQAFMANDPPPPPPPAPDANVPLPPPPPLPPAPPRDNSSADGSDVIATLLFGGLAVAAVAAVLGSDAGDAAPPPPSGDHGVSLEACIKDDNLANQFGFNVPGVSASITGCIH